MKIRLHENYTASPFKHIGAFKVEREWKECDSSTARSAMPFATGDRPLFEIILGDDSSAPASEKGSPPKKEGGQPKRKRKAE